MNKDIFLKHFNGNLDELAKFTQDNADFVDNVLSEREDFDLTDEQAITVICMENPSFTREQAAAVYDQIKLDIVNDNIKVLLDEGSIEVAEYGDDGEPKYQLTEAGKKRYKNLFDK